MIDDYESWWGDRANHLNAVYNSSRMPAKPVVQYTGPGGFPLDGLTFSNSAFSDPQGNNTFEALEWRIAEWSDPSNPTYDTIEEEFYEVTALWQSDEITSFSNTYTLDGRSLQPERTYRVRVRYKDNTGRKSRWSDPVQFVASPPQNNATPDLVISEIMYNANKSCGENFIEISNNSTQLVDLTGYSISGDVAFTFPDGSFINPNASVTIANDATAFEYKFFNSPLGQWEGNLDDTTGSIQLTGAYGTFIDEVDYNTSASWPINNIGYSIYLSDLNVNNQVGSNWKLSNQCGYPNAQNVEAVDSDQDGYPNDVDQCTGINDELIGTPCDDNNVCTIGETYDNACNCSGGKLFDDDNDGICNILDQCPNFDDALIGTPCDDGLTCTTGETYDSNCNCSGGTFADSDQDGVCDAEDQCPNFNDNLIGSPCDDGDVCTTGEMYDSNCNCSGGSFADNDQDGVCDTDDQCPNFNDNLIGSPCDDGDVCTTGEVYDTNCNCSGGTFADNDQDGVCDANDQCPNFNNNLIGSPCDDGDVCTQGETYDSNCMCTGGIFQDADNDNVCDAMDQCPNIDDAIIGTSCDDGDDCTTGETYDNNCNCGGGMLLDFNNNDICDLLESDCDILFSDNFELNEGIWQTGGNDAERLFTANSPQGDYAMRIRDNSGISSSIFTAALDMTAVDTLRIGFNFIAIGMDVNESFFLEISNDNGATFTIINEWIIGTTFQNNILYFESLVIDNTQLSGSTMLRFRCNGSINSDEVYLDNIILRSCEAECVDADGDSICDADDNCPGIDDSIIGTACDDGDPCTVGEIWSSTCACTGGENLDSDGDSICDALDICPGFDDTLIGQPCDDGDPCTEGETYAMDCSCTGGIFQDADNDGICDVDDNECIQLVSEDFEMGAGIWQSNGIDAAYVMSADSPSGNYAFRIRDNSGVASSVSSLPIDLSMGGTANITFAFKAKNLSVGENFFLEISLDGGVSFSEIGRWVNGVDFDNEVINNQTVELTENQLGTSTMFRFTSDASINFDQIFLDDINIESCPSDCLSVLIENNNSSIDQSEAVVNSITTNGIIPAGFDIDYSAENYILMTEGFEVQLGAVYHAFIAPCQ